MTHLGLFEGIGGFSLAARWMGWETLAWCEWNEFGQKVLRHHFPNAEGFGDITKTDFTKYANRIDIVTGGFPCQPYSLAGKRLGKEDERHLWSEMLRAIREIKPKWVVGENVFGIINWNGGMVFNEVQAELEAEGYEVQPYVLPACGKNAPHRRDRVWFIAYNKHRGDRWREQQQESEQEKSSNAITNSYNNRDMRQSGEHESKGKEKRIQERNAIQQPEISNSVRGNVSDCESPPMWEQFPTQPPLCSGDDELPTKLDGITFSKWRTESIKAYGNAIVPEVAYEIFKAINLLKI